MMREARGYGIDSMSEEDFLASVATDLTAPLIFIRQLGLSLSGEHTDQKSLQTTGERITITTERALRLVSQLSATTYGQTKLQLEPINPLGICRDVISELQPTYKAYGKHIEKLPRARAQLIVGDRRLLRHILIGLGDNALYYNSKEKPARIMIESKGSRIRIGVRDFGPVPPTNIWKNIDNSVIGHGVISHVSRAKMNSTTLIAVRKLARIMGTDIGYVRHQDGATFYIDLHKSRQMNLI